jgi:hypothetical protein
MKTCFVAMPVTVPPSSQGPYEDADHFLQVYVHLFVPALREVEYEPISPIHTGSEIIHAEIVKNLHEADLVLCDISTLNANVFFEFGIRTALDKPICLVADSTTLQIPFDAGIINRHVYPARLRIGNIDQERQRLVLHLKETLAKGDGRNALWKHFGIETTGQFHPASYSESDRLDHIIQMLNALSREAAPKGPKRGFNVMLDALRVQDWAAKNKARNAWDMEPRNFERCLFDLGLEGGVDHELLYDEGGYLKYQ